MSVSFDLKPLVWALTAGFAACGSALAADDAASTRAGTCRPSATAFAAVAKPVTSGEDRLPAGNTRLTADDLAGQSQVKVRAEGAVVVERDQQVLNADWVDYNQQTQDLSAGQQFTLADGDSVISGGSLRYNLDTRAGEATEARFAAEKDGRRLQGRGEQLSMDGQGHYRLRQTRFNTCDPGDDSWYIEADSIDADYTTNIGVARNAKFVIGGVPLLYTPWIDFPLNGDRKSGLMAPLVKVGSDGFELATPYYFNLAPNYDATLTPHLISRRGLQLEGEFRYLQPRYQGTVGGAWLPNDRASRHNNRYRFDWQHQHRFSAGLSGGIDFHQVSDNDYYRDLMGSGDSNQVNLNRQLWLDYQNNLLGGRFSGYFTVQKYQTLSSLTGYKDPPYAMLPRISANWSRYFDNTFSANVLFQATRFDHDRKQTGNRVVLYPTVAADFHNSWGFVRPKLGLHATHYDLSRFENLPSRNVSRILPMLSVDSGMVLERPWQWGGRHYVQTLEPRLFYTYIPQREQNDLPLFDTTENSFTYEQLFRENRFSGQDRINAANFLTTALQTRLYDGQTGAERLSAGIGQRFYFNKDDVLLDGSLQRNERDRSDFLAFVRGQVSDSVHVDGSWHYNQNLENTERLSVGVRYSPQPGKVVSMRYRFGRYEEIYDDHYGKIRQVDTAVQWPIRQNYYLVARYNYDLTHSRTLQQLLGLEYQSPCRCWSASVVGQRYVNGLNSTKNAVFVQLQLRNLTSVGNNPFEQLRTAIPGYRNLYEVNH